MIKVVIFTLVQIVLFYVVLCVIKKTEEVVCKETNIIVNVNWKVGLIFLLSTTLIYFKFKDNIYYIYYIYFNLYFILTAYIDYKTCYIYSSLNYLTMMVGISLLYFQNNLFNIGSILMYSVIIIITNKIFKFYGDGDTELYICISFILCSLCYEFPIALLLVNMLLSNVVAIILNVKSFQLKGMKFKKAIAFAPSIVLSTIIMILLI